MQSVKELKKTIKLKAQESKEMKKILSKPHTLDTCNIMYQHYKLKCELRVIYALYGYLRGKRFDQIERNVSKDSTHVFTYYAKQIIDNEDIYKGFCEWLKYSHVGYEEAA